MEKLGIDTKIIIAQVVNFVLLLVVFQRFVYGPFIKKIAEEKRKKQEGEETAARMSKKEVELDKQRVKLETEFEKKAKDLYAKMKKEADTSRKKIIDEAHKDAEEIRRHTMELIESEKEKSLAQIKKEAYKISALLVERATEDIMTPQTHKQVTKDIVKKLPTLKNVQ